MRIIINADDYGIDIETTQAILEAFRIGYCTSTTIMANGAAFEKAVELAKANQITDKIGLHLNLTYGEPLTESIRKMQKFCDENGLFNGNFHFNTARFTYFSAEEKAAVAIEIKAQIERCLNSGIRLSHVDSHHHIHTRWEVWRAAEPIIRSYNLQRVRISRNCGPNISLIKNIGKYLCNLYLRRTGFQTADYFGNTWDVAELLSAKPQLIKSAAVIEVMNHPKYNATKELVDLAETLMLAESYQRISPGLKTAELIAYSSL